MCQNNITVARKNMELNSENLWIILKKYTVYILSGILTLLSHPWSQNISPDIAEEI